MDRSPGKENTRRAVVVDNLHKNFGPLEVLKGVSLAAHEGDVIAMIGSSGSGKSTLLRCINFLEIPASGEIYVENEHIRPYPKPKRADRTGTTGRLTASARNWGWYFQHFNLWSHMTVLDNVIEAPIHVLKKPKKESREKGMAYLEKVGIADRSHYYPAQLSGGQNSVPPLPARSPWSQRCFCLTNRPRHLIRNWWAKCFNRHAELAKEGRTMIMATHEMGFARDVSSHVIFLHNGIIEDEGPPDYIFIKPEIRALPSISIPFFQLSTPCK
jgi:ABC-type histidine transport system ATPase subunit